MAYLYRNGTEYLLKYSNDEHGKPQIAKPRKFSKTFMRTSKRRE